MKKYILSMLYMFFILWLSGCRKDMNYIIENESYVVGIVEEVTENTIVVYCEEMEGYLSGAKCRVSLDVENKDSMTHFDVGDEVVVYYNGEVAETDPLEINTVYAITLRKPADRADIIKSQEAISIEAVEYKEWTEQEIASLFVSKADVDWKMIKCVSVYDFAFERIGVVLYTDSESEYINVAFMDDEGNLQHCGVEAILDASPEFTYCGNGEVTFKVCSKDGKKYTQKITFSRSEIGVNFVSEAIE